MEIDSNGFSYTYNPAFCGLCKEIITFATLYQKNYSYERDKSPRDNPRIRLRDVDAGTQSDGYIF